MTAKQYNEIVRTYSGRLYGFLIKRIGDREDASDIVQDSFLKLWENRKKVESKKAGSWLFTTAHRIMLNKIKRESRKSRLELNGNGCYVNGVSGHVISEPVVRGGRRFEIREVINKCLDRLSPLHKSIILLRDLEGYNYREIGEILELNESQVKVYLFRARRKIKDQLKDINVII